jgi:MFS_1 like family
VICENPTNVDNFQLTHVNNENLVCHNEQNITKLIIDNEIECKTIEDINAPPCFYKSWTFWLYVFFSYFGTIGYNVGNSISDAICFDVLGTDRQMKYGKQRIYGSIGFGLTSLAAGYAMDLQGNSFMIAIYIMMIFGIFDLLSIFKLTLPKFSSTESLFKDVSKLIRHRKIAIFLCFATIAGILDSFLFFFMFWYLEDVAEQTELKDRVKLIEGLVIAAECLFGEVLFFQISGKIIKKLGYIHSLTFCFFCYFLRFLFISLMTSPWQLIFIEIIMQGCTFALTYTCVVGEL